MNIPDEEGNHWPHTGIMTVAELIGILKEFDPDAVVRMGGKEVKGVYRYINFEGEDSPQLHTNQKRV